MKISACLSIIFILLACQEQSLNSGIINIEMNDKMMTHVSTSFSNIPLMDNFQAAEVVFVNNKSIAGFSLLSNSKNAFSDSIGNGKMITFSGSSDDENVPLTKVVKIKIYDQFPQIAVFDVSYINNGKNSISISGWVNNKYFIKGTQDSVPFWSFQSGSYESRPDWVLPLKDGFEQENYMGMNASDYGGGTPVSDIWRKDAGLAVGHLERVPKLVSLPVRSEDVHKGAQLSVQYKKDIALQPADTLKTFTTFVAVHKGDYYNALTEYSRFMQSRGVKFPVFPETAYQPIWCAWGYERNFTKPQIINTLPKVSELGYKWAVLDDGWQTAEGDWYLNPKKFPAGDKDMLKFTNDIHSKGLKAKLWWAPLAVDPGTDLIKNHPDMLLINKDGKNQLISWWDSYYLCPAYEPTLQYTKNLVIKMLKDWGYDGLKIDGQHLNAVPPCYNPLHHHAYPEESVEKLPAFWKMVYQTATEIKPDAVVEICPCGTAASFFNMPYMNQPVSSDPTSSWQIRSKGKTFKALMGPQTPYYGDHVELSSGGEDFASSVGIGAVIGTKFIWPPGVHLNTESGDVSLTPEREKKWKKWVDIYLKNELSKGDYQGSLYDIGFDKPESHVIKKDNNLFYSFYAKSFQGKVELRGLQQGTYKITDYVNQIELGSVSRVKPNLDIKFNGFLLLEASPL
jgi:alpha-galactosidase